MLHDQVITFLETTIIILLLTNAVSMFATAYALSLARRRLVPATAVARKAQAAFAAMWPHGGR